MLSKNDTKCVHQLHYFMVVSILKHLSCYMMLIRLEETFPDISWTSIPDRFILRYLKRVIRVTTNLVLLPVPDGGNANYISMTEFLCCLKMILSVYISYIILW